MFGKPPSYTEARLREMERDIKLLKIEALTDAQAMSLKTALGVIFTHSWDNSGLIKLGDSNLVEISNLLNRR